MAQSKNTRNIAVDQDIADQIKKLADKHNMSMLEMTNALLKNALELVEIKVEVKKIELVTRATLAKRSK